MPSKPCTIQEVEAEGGEVKSSLYYAGSLRLVSITQSNVQWVYELLFICLNLEMKILGSFLPLKDVFLHTSFLGVICTYKEKHFVLFTFPSAHTCFLEVS